MWWPIPIWGGKGMETWNCIVIKLDKVIIFANLGESHFALTHENIILNHQVGSNFIRPFSG